jgi:putative FmdB family regulatory protein
VPIYEFRCTSCGLRQSVFFRSFDVSPNPSCRRCGSSDLRKLVSSFYAVKSEEARLESMADPGGFGDLDENDPRSVARWAKKMAKETGEDMGTEFDEMVDRLEAGEMPEGDGDTSGLGMDDSLD